jgi:hypothetical protein
MLQHRSLNCFEFHAISANFNLIVRPSDNLYLAVWPLHGKVTRAK